MNIADNILKYHLRNMYFFGGTACGGKTTMSKRFAEKYGFPLYSELVNITEHKQIASDAYQPAMAKKFADWHAYFTRPPQEFAQWLRDTQEEDLEMVLMDLIAKASGQTVIVDIHIPLEKARRLIDYHRIVFLVAESALVLRDCHMREEHRDILDCIMRLPNPDGVKKNVEDTLVVLTEQFLRELKRTDWYYIERDTNSTIEGTLTLIEKHFGLI